MTVVDLRERFGLARLSTAIPSPRRSPEMIGSLDGRDLHRITHVAPMWRVGLLDALSAALAALLAGAVWTGLGVLGSLVLVAAWLIALQAQGAYRRTPIRTDVTSSRPVLRAGFAVCAGAALLSVAVAAVDVRGVAGAAVAATALTLMGRQRWGGRLLGRADAGTPTVLVRGRGDEVAALLARLDAESARPFTVSAVQATDGALDADLRVRELLELPADKDLVTAAVDARVDAVLLVGGQQESAEDLRRHIWRLEGHGVGAFLVPMVVDLATPRVSSLEWTGIPVVELATRDQGAEAGITKLVIDRGLALAALVALAPVLVLIALAVAVTSEGPVLFRQVRVGWQGRTFGMLKFRTMYVDAEQRRAELEALNRHAGGTLFKMADDPRITPVGRYLRKLSMDELPQLINVLRGEMSMVGPRPPLPSEVANYPLDAHRRFCVRPGLTGLWQVSGRSDLDPEESIRLDAHYVEHWSPTMDLTILARTPRVVLTGEGAY